MTANFTIHQRPGELDRLSEAVISSWNRPVAKPLYRGSVWVIFFTALTFGLWPLFKARRWLKDYAAIRQQRCESLAEWFNATQTDPVAADQLRSLAHRIRISPLLRLLMLLTLIVALCVVVHDSRHHQSPWAWYFAEPIRESQQTFLLFIGCAVALLIAQLATHHRHFKEFLATLNPILASHDLKSVSAVSLLSFNLLDWIGGIALSWRGAIWPFLTIVSVGLLRSYIRRHLRVHVQIGERVRELLARQGSPLRLPARNDLLNRCANPTLRRDPAGGRSLLLTLRKSPEASRRVRGRMIRCLPQSSTPNAQRHDLHVWHPRGRRLGVDRCRLRLFAHPKISQTIKSR